LSNLNPFTRYLLLLFKRLKSKPNGNHFGSILNKLELLGSVEPVEILFHRL
jgi:hypothetical protein